MFTFQILLLKRTFKYLITIGKNVQVTFLGSSCSLQEMHGLDTVPRGRKGCFLIYIQCMCVILKIKKGIPGAMQKLKKYYETERLP